MAANDMMLVSGQYQADFGAPSNERSGKAIQQRQRQGENATYHYIDHLAKAIRFTGKIILDLVPKIYDTKRVIKIMAEDGKQSDVTIDPAAKQSYVARQIMNQETAKEVIFNPAIGRYDVQADVGPDYGTQREEAFNALSQIIMQNPDLVKVAGDLLMKSADFPLADELAERLERMVPPELKGEGPNPQVVQLQQQMQAMQQLLASMGERLKEKGDEEAHKGAEVDVRAYEAVTKRLDMVLERLGPVPGADDAEKQALLSAHQTELDMASATHQAGLQMITAEHAQSIAPQPEAQSA